MIKHRISSISLQVLALVVCLVDGIVGLSSSDPRRLASLGYKSLRVCERPLVIMFERYTM